MRAALLWKSCERLWKTRPKLREMCVDSATMNR